MVNTVTRPIHSIASPGRLGPFVQLRGHCDGPTATDDRVYVLVYLAVDADGISEILADGWSGNLHGGTSWSARLGVVPDAQNSPEVPGAAAADGTLLIVEVDVVHAPYTSWATQATIVNEFSWDRVGLMWTRLGTSGTDVSAVLAAIQRTYQNTP